MNKLEVRQQDGMSVFAGNDYLGMARDPRLAGVLSSAVSEYGISSTSSRWALGWTDIHAKLEDELARFFGAADAVIIGAAYFGGLIYYSVMREKYSVVFCDESSHSNQFLGMRAAGFDVRKFKHLDVEDLRRQLEAYDGPPPIIATDGVYGISGEIAPLAELSALAKEYSAELFVDDAHGVVVLGDSGKGACELAGVSPDDVTLLGSMSKAMGCNGGFICGKKELVEKFRRSVPASGSAIPPSLIAAACLEALYLIQEEPERRQKCHDIAERMRGDLEKCGIGVVCKDSPIIAMCLDDGKQASELSEHFLAHKILIPYFTYASEPRQNLLRAVARSCYTEEEMQRFSDALESWQKIVNS
ncbi:MAG: pyridoxal phosphate-dependent aminotransferase family protein [Kiritimatiellae bacterium]|nr:pyridoxal phosphate-dependent aminotransferase family protein [Kiritimatiellia bacterium]